MTFDVAPPDGFELLEWEVRGKVKLPDGRVQFFSSLFDPKLPLVLGDDYWKDFWMQVKNNRSHH